MKERISTVYIYDAHNIRNMIIPEKDEELCEFCLGSGEVTTYEQVYPGEPHVADVGTETCICMLDFDESDIYDETQP